MRLKGWVCIKEGKGGWGWAEGYCLIGELALLAKPPLTSATLLRSVWWNKKQRGGGIKTQGRYEFHCTHWLKDNFTLKKFNLVIINPQPHRCKHFWNFTAEQCCSILLNPPEVGAQAWPCFEGVNIVISSQSGIWGLWRLGIMLYGCMEQFHVFIMFPFFNLSCLGECCNVVLPWSSKCFDVLWTTKVEYNDLIDIFGWIYPLK